MHSESLVNRTETDINRQIWPENLSIIEFCTLIGMSRRTYQRMRLEGTGPAATWIHGRQVILRRSVQEWVEARTERPGRPWVLSHAS